MATAATPAAARRTARLRLRYGRLAIAAVGALAAVTLVVGGVLAPFGVVAASVPGYALAVLAASFIGLRSLAVRERRRRSLARMEAAFAEAMSGPLVATPPRRDSELFDAQTATAVDPSAALTAQEARAEARRAAAAESRPVEAQTWDPVQVPRPLYVDAQKAERPAPEPFAAAEPKRPQTVTSILQDTRIQSAAEAGGSGVAPLPAPADATATAAAVAPAHGSDPEGRINLDAVLQRRRA